MISHLKEFILKNENFQKLLFVKYNISHRFAPNTNFLEEVDKTVEC